MPYKVSFDKSDGIVSVIVSGIATKEDHYAARDEAFKLCRGKKCSKVLIDLRDLHAENYSTMECFTFGESVVLKAPSVRLAHVLPKNIESREQTRFTSNVEANRGLHTNEFTTIEEARDWLNK